MKSLIVIFSILISVSSFASSSEALIGTAEQQVSVLVDGERYYCSKSGSGGGGEYKCVQNCLSRNSNGSCYNYASDFCGVNASCTVSCLSRNSNGSCYNYGSDICRKDN